MWELPRKQRNDTHNISDVMEFIRCRRFETLTLHRLLQGFSTSACDWLMPPGETARQQSRVSVSDALKRKELLEEFLYWYFDSFVSSLLKVSCHLPYLCATSEPSRRPTITLPSPQLLETECSIFVMMTGKFCALLWLADWPLGHLRRCLRYVKVTKCYHLTSDH